MIVTKEFIDSLGCPDADAYLIENNLYGVTDSELLNHLEENNILFYHQAKPLIEEQKAEIIKSSGAYTLGRYKVISENEQICDTEQERNEKVLEIQNDSFSKIAVNFVVNHADIKENGDHTWINIDLDTTEYQENFNVFSPLTGQYNYCKTLEEAKNSFNLVKSELLALSTPKVQREIIGESGEVSWIFEDEL